MSQLDKQSAAQLCELTEVEPADGDLDEIVQLHSKSVQEKDETTTAPSTSEEDNYDSDDDDDCKSNHSNSNRSSKQQHRYKGDVKRSHHNVLERKRRDLIKDSFAQLKQVVPTISKERASRAQILKEAADFIQRSLQRNEAIKSQLSDYMRKNAELERSFGKDDEDKDDDSGIVVKKDEDAPDPSNDQDPSSNS